MKEEDSVISQKVISARSQLDESSRSKSNSGLLANLKKFVSEQVSHGILGKLGELGSIEDKYDVAVTTACPALDNIVVTTTEVAQQCVEILRTKKLGRATFIILHEIRNLIERLPIKDSQDFRKFISDIKPGLNLTKDVTTPSGDIVQVEVGFGVEFFRPFYGL